MEGEDTTALDIRLEEFLERLTPSLVVPSSGATPAPTWRVCSWTASARACSPWPVGSEPRTTARPCTTRPQPLGVPRASSTRTALPGHPARRGSPRGFGLPSTSPCLGRRAPNPNLLGGDRPPGFLQGRGGTAQAAATGGTVEGASFAPFQELPY